MENKELRIAEIEEILDSHDCHASPMDGCQCSVLLEELAGLIYSDTSGEWPISPPRK